MSGTAAIWIRGVPGIPDGYKSGSRRKPGSAIQFGLQKYISRGKENRTEAAAWFQKAAAQGHPIARSMLAKMLGTDDKDANSDVVRALMMNMSFSEMAGERIQGSGGASGPGLG
jgi:hypothetical protein